jgi:hypothetical protein
LGEVVLTQLLGESASFRISGIPSSIALPATLDDLQDCNVAIAFEADEREFPLRALEGLGGFALEKFGSLSKELEEITQLLLNRMQKQRYESYSRK